MNTLTIDGIEISCLTIYRRIKNPRIEFENGVFRLIIPHGYKDAGQLIARHKRWIKNRILHFMEIKKLAAELPLPDAKDKDVFKDFAIGKAKKIADELGVMPEIIVFRRLKSRWGSCSSRNKITINSVLRFMPERFTEYIVFHEIAHLVERKHNKRFNGIIVKRFPDTELIEKQLTAYWYILSGKHIRQDVEKTNVQIGEI